MVVVVVKSQIQVVFFVQPAKTIQHRVVHVVVDGRIEPVFDVIGVLRGLAGCAALEGGKTAVCLLVDDSEFVECFVGCV